MIALIKGARMPVRHSRNGGVILFLQHSMEHQIGVAVRNGIASRVLLTINGPLFMVRRHSMAQRKVQLGENFCITKACSTVDHDDDDDDKEEAEE